MYTCRLYQNSGLNSVNTIDNGALLDTLNYIDVPALDVVQERLAQIAVKATWAQVKNCDFCRLSDGTTTIYYAVNGAGITMSATDVAVLPVVLDYILTYGIGGAYLDGITTRAHVKTDNYGEYTEPDELLTPNNPLQLKSFWSDPAAITGEGESLLIETTVNPEVTYYAKPAEVYATTDSAGGAVSCVVPAIAYNEQETEYYIGETKSKISPGTCVYNMNTSITRKAVSQTLRSLNGESAIIRQVSVPNVYCTIEQQTATSTEYQYNTGSGTYIAYFYISKITGNSLLFNGLELPYVNTSAKNNRINYSDFTKYGIITCSGDKLEAAPADVYDPDSEYIQIASKTDPHLDGRPYFRFNKMNGAGGGTDFWRGCIPGMAWKSVPLIYEGAAGSALNTLKFDAAQQANIAGYNTAELVYRNTQTRAGLQAAKSGIEAAAGIAGSIINPWNAGEGITGAINAANNAAMSLYDMSARSTERAAQRTEYQTARRSELLDFAINNNVVVPVVEFPYNTEALRDFYGNGIFLYRYEYTAADVQRIDRLLTMYGYKVTKALEKSDFTNRAHFNFVQCNNISVTGAAQWINEGIAEQLRAGVRIWHELPNIAAYDDNPVKGA